LSPSPGPAQSFAALGPMETAPHLVDFQKRSCLLSNRKKDPTCSHELHALPLFHTDLPHWWAHARNRRPASTASEPQNIEERPGSGDPGQPNDSPWITCRVFRATTPATRPRNSGGCSRLRRSVLIHIYS